MVTVVISTANEAQNISACIKSAKLLTADIVVLDMASTDGTPDVARQAGAQVISVPVYGYVEPVRRIAIEKAAGPWVCILDADERMTSELAHEINEIVHQKTPPFTSYKIPRKNIFGTTWLKHGGWYPDAQIRLINKPAFIDWPNRIHSTPNISGSMGQLTHPMLHLFHGNVSQMVQKTTVYEQIESSLLHEAKKKVSTHTFFRKFFGELFRRLVKFAGWRDGMMGWIESIYQAYSKTITYLYLYEKTYAKQ